MQPLVLLPAVDVAGGQAVQLVQGKLGSEKTFGDPRAAAQRWADDGAEWIHLVDLDAAFGHGDNASLISEIVAETTAELGLSVELSGGIRDDATLDRALSTGCARVNIGTAALERPDWCEQIIADHGERIAIGLDVRGTRLAARGWTREGGDLDETLRRLDEAGCARFVVTDVASDGMLSGPNLDLLRRVCAATDKPVVASGGISTLADVRALAALVDDGVEGAIIGTALYVGNFTLPEALQAAGTTTASR
ncbi:MAG TPA: bifunctional 1-(5-phosphoribosyl)-5-((5-phosphoribosylamino)methylideneamino)imidazole-4-carboxamide isomerase/phosphoribosylanthranilate isomerase PriA [Propionibacteriaceae bacterium]|nr:bifunctional 1-(5-phosphoribosyl)-5-((5-phosphoribosylamino)methylideneamino)imidazole-4-carboxamide isomerase/phosphoribosylanthranilate isomerase PriA [Propionibacteriaceae bacterium]